MPQDLFGCGLTFNATQGLTHLLAHLDTQLTPHLSYSLLFWTPSLPPITQEECIHQATLLRFHAT